MDARALAWSAEGGSTAKFAELGRLSLRCSGLTSGPDAALPNVAWFSTRYAMGGTAEVLLSQQLP